MTLPRQLLIIAIIAAAAAVGWVYVMPLLGSAEAVAPKRGGKAKSVSIVAREVTTARETVRIQVVGTSQASRSATLHPAAAGEITRINFAADERIDAGQVLLELDSETEQLMVDLARVRLDDARRTFKRLDRLMPSGAVATSTLDDARSALEAARIALRQAEVALADRVMIAPFAGRAGLTDLDIGDRVDTDTPVTSLDQRAVLLVGFDVPEALLGKIGKGDRISASPWSDRGIAREGMVFDVGSRIDARTRTFRVRASVENPDDALRPGMSFRVASEIVGAAYPVVPEIAVQWGGDGSFVWAVRDGTARRVSARIVQRQEAVILVDAALGPGDKVVVEGFHRMREGRKVSIASSKNPGS